MACCGVVKSLIRHFRILWLPEAAGCILVGGTLSLSYVILCYLTLPCVVLRYVAFAFCLLCLFFLMHCVSHVSLSCHNIIEQSWPGTES
jgi:hypothetical protein